MKLIINVFDEVFMVIFDKTALYTAVENENVEIVGLLLKKNYIDINILCIYKYFFIQFETIFLIEFLKIYFLNAIKNHEINRVNKTKFYQSALQLARQKGNVLIIQLMDDHMK